VASVRSRVAPDHGRFLFSQSSIYDLRYSGSGYDHRSAVRVLTAEEQVLRRAVDRAVVAGPGTDEILLLDFGYGTGRVTNDLALDHQGPGGLAAAGGRDLHVIAYDVSLVGLRTAATHLHRRGFEPITADVDPDGAPPPLRHVNEGVRATVTFVHGIEHDTGRGHWVSDPAEMRAQVLRATDDRACTVMTSWYSGLGHIPGRELRSEFFTTLAQLTEPRGEMVIAVSTTGDPVDEQPDWARGLSRRVKRRLRLEEPTDVIYETELGQTNYWHRFGTDLDQHLAELRTAGQFCWTEAIRFPGPEFRNEREEQDNHRLVQEFNEGRRGRRWTADDYAAVHTAAVFRSAGEPPKPRRTTEDAQLHDSLLVGRLD
jgi:hypothetical protein